MTRLLYDLRLADPAVRPSPYCWTVKLALHHKGLPYETRAVPFADKSLYPDPDYGRVPVLVDDDGEVMRDSLAILKRLDEKYPARQLAASDGARASAAFYAAWSGSTLMAAMAPMLLLRVAATCDPADRAYFRTTREARFGRSLEEVAATPGARERTEAALGLLAAPLGTSPWLGGASPDISDYVVAGPFLWARSVTTAPLFSAPPAVGEWLGRLLDLHDGLGRNAASAEAP